MEQNTGSYFFCAKRDLPRLIERAQREAADVLKDFKAFFAPAGDLQIRIEPRGHGVCWSVGAVLTWDGEPVRSEDDAGLLFLTLNELVLNQMIKLGFPSFGRREEATQ